MPLTAAMRALPIALALCAACAPVSDVRFHALSSSWSPSSSRRQHVDVYLTHAPERPFRVVGLVVVAPSYDLRAAARLAASTAVSVGCELITMHRDGEVATRSVRRPRVMVASIIGGSFGSDEAGWGSGGSRGGRSSGYTGPTPSKDPIDPRMTKFWCGEYVAPL